MCGCCSSSVSSQNIIWAAVLSPLPSSFFFHRHLIITLSFSSIHSFWILCSHGPQHLHSYALLLFWCFPSSSLLGQPNSKYCCFIIASPNFRLSPSLFFFTSWSEEGNLFLVILLLIYYSSSAAPSAIPTFIHSFLKIFFNSFSSAPLFLGLPLLVTP